jgi:stage V sporulation protein G
MGRTLFMEDIKITNVRIHILDRDKNSKTVATASITLNDCFVVHGIKVVEGRGGLFVSMPRKKSATREATDIVHPTRTDVRKKISDLVLHEYEKVKNKRDNK